ncbi:Myotubularin-related protein 13 [Globisporangium polare]
MPATATQQLPLLSPVSVSVVLPQPAATSNDPQPQEQYAPSLALEDVVRDAHMHSVFLQYLSSHDKKGFARLLFLVSVDEFKKLLGASDSSSDRLPLQRQQHSESSMNNRESSYAADYEDDDEAMAAADQTRRNYRQIYASKIITKFMSKDSFLDIASENLKILNKSVWSFGSFLRNDLMMCSGLSSKVDLFYDAEIAVKKALQPSFEQFSHTKEFVDLLRNARLTYALVAEEMASASACSTDEDQNSASTTSEASDCNTSSSPGSGPPSVSKSSSSYLTIERVLGNRRLCSIFWVFLFKERTHEQLSLWMDFRYHLIPLLVAFIDAAKADISQDNLDDDEDDPDQDEDDEDKAQTNEAKQVESQQYPQPGELIEQLLSVGGRISSKYLEVDAGTFVTFVGEAERELLEEYERRVALCMDAGSFSLADAEVMVRTVQRISSVIEYNLKVNHFVRFMGSESFKSLVSCYQSRLLSPLGSNSNRVMSTADSPEESTMQLMSSSTSSSSDSSMTTLQELFHCMNVPSHQPQRIRSKKFTLRDLFQSQIRGESPSKSLISSVISFRLDTSDKANPHIEKNVLHTLASKDADMRHHHAIPDHVEAFFCPSGAEIIRAKSCPEPKLFHMTIGNSEKAFYGACLTRYVPQSDDSQLGPLELVLRETEGLEVYVPVGLCLISRYPILDTLKKRLNDMHLGMRNANETYFSDPHWVPNAAQMGDLLSPFDFTTIATNSGSSSSLSTSLPNLANYVDFSMEELFNCLSIENVVALVTCMLLERQVVLLSSRYSVLTCVGETLKSLIAPLVWSHVFAPILPKSMLECLQCPTPYLFGVHSSYQKELFEMLSREGSCDSIVMVDLDADTLSTAVQPHLPDALRQPLHSTLQQLLKPRVFFSDYVPMCGPASGPNAVQSRRFPERRMRLCFQHTVAQLLDRLEEFRFVLSDDFDYVVVFDRVAFLRSLPSGEVAFFRAFLETQVFSHEIASVA